MKFKKKIYFYILQVIAIFFIARPDTLSAQTFDNTEVANYLEYNWDGNEDDLYLDLVIPKTFEFSSKYYQTKNENELICEVIFKPKAGRIVYSLNRLTIDEISLKVMLTNFENSNGINYVLESKIYYKPYTEDGSKKWISDEYKLSGTLKNPAIDLSQKPIFYIIKDNSSEGYITFKNQFPFSKMH